MLKEKFSEHETLFHQTRKTKLKNYKADLAFLVRSELLAAMVLPSSLADFTLTAS